MTTYEAVALFLSFAALCGLIISVRELRHQVQAMNAQAAQQQKALEVSAEVSLDSLFVVATQAFLAYPELRAVFNEDEVDPTSDTMSRNTKLRACALAENLADAMERSLDYVDTNLSKSASTLRHWIRDSFRNSAFFREWLSGRRDWYSESLMAILDDVQRDMLAAASSPPPASPTPR